MHEITAFVQLETRYIVGVWAARISVIMVGVSASRQIQVVHTVTSGSLCDLYLHSDPPELVQGGLLSPELALITLSLVSRRANSDYSEPREPARELFRRGTTRVRIAARQEFDRQGKGQLQFPRTVRQPPLLFTSILPSLTLRGSTKSLNNIFTHLT
jgi:hypothetical protein